MMPKSAAQTFLAIPELVVLLSLHVRKQDLPRCILVCRDWLHHFKPVLWRDLDIDERVFSVLNNVPPPRLARNLRHTQKVHFSCADGSKLQLLTLGLPYQLSSTVSDPGAGCTNLKHISMFYLDIDDLELMSRPLVTLLDYNPHLTRLEVPHDFFHIDGVSAAVSKLWNLQQLYIKCVEEHAIIQRPLLFLQSCLALPELTKLTFHTDTGMYWDHGEETTIVRNLEAIINAAVIGRFSQNPTPKRIKTLRLPANLSGIRNPLPLLLIKSKLLDLETCEIPWFRGDVTTWKIEQVVQEHCSNLKHLECPQNFEEGQDGQAARAFIRGCSGLRSFTSAYPYVWLTASTTKRAYQQIGHLKKLEVLVIDIDKTSGTKAKEQDYEWDLTLRKGWLGEWKGLKNLTSLTLRVNVWSCMSQEVSSSCTSTGLCWKKLSSPPISRKFTTSSIGSGF